MKRFMTVALLLLIALPATVCFFAIEPVLSNRWETESPDQLRILTRECFEQGGRSTVRVKVASEEDPRTYYITCQK